MNINKECEIKSIKMTGNIHEEQKIKDRFKFRAWNKHHKEMYDVYHIDLNFGLIFCESAEGITHTFGFIDCDLLQCTGLKDRNGILIFEGDIVDLHGDKLAVMFWYNRFLMVHEPSCGAEREGECITDEFQSSYSQNNVEIIGNIH
tara:strand:- start:53 stop:490 length:438 start_codon:yes stop_codon:yes gene_type:complete